MRAKALIASCFECRPKQEGHRKLSPLAFWIEYPKAKKASKAIGVIDKDCEAIPVTERSTISRLR
tara:strand:+ start:524 stop:718 length:195 start_codon:yes stop_codon:yes gene_type:complete